MSMLINSENGKITNLMLSGDELRHIAAALKQFINEHEEFDDVKNIIGDFTREQIRTIDKIIAYR